MYQSDYTREKGLEQRNLALGNALADSLRLCKVKKTVAGNALIHAEDSDQYSYFLGRKKALQEMAVILEQARDFEFSELYAKLKEELHKLPPDERKPFIRVYEFQKYQ